MSIGLLYLAPIALGAYGFYKRSRADATPEQKQLGTNLMLAGGLGLGTLVLLDETTSVFAPLRYGEKFRQAHRHPYTDYAGRYHPRGLTESQIDRLIEENERGRLMPRPGPTPGLFY
jgi:hypothetical protein